MIHPLAKQGHYRIYLRGRLSFGAVYVKVKNHFLKSTVNMMDPLAERSKAISRDVCSMELKLTVSGGSNRKSQCHQLSTGPSGNIFPIRCIDIDIDDISDTLILLVTTLFLLRVA